MLITMYTTHCPQCNVLQEKLNAANIEFNIIEDVNTIAAKGIDAVPVLDVDGVCMNFKEAVNWINKKVR